MSLTDTMGMFLLEILFYIGSIVFDIKDFIWKLRFGRIIIYVNMHTADMLLALREDDLLLS